MFLKRLDTFAVLAAGLAMTMGSAQPAFAQGEFYEPQTTRTDVEEVWYQPDEWRTSEWYDDEETVEEWLRGDYDYGYVEDESAFRRYDYDGYYDGYEDGYHGLSAAFRPDEALPANDPATGNYRNAYVNGYQDGSYDRDKQFDADAYYYVYVVDRSEVGKASDAQRERDNSRHRGDRCTQFTRRGTDAYETDRSTHRQRIRGTVTDMKALDSMSDHRIVQLSFEGGRSVQADFGPHMTADALPISPGDRVTLVGRKEALNGSDLFVTNRVIINEDKYTLRGLRLDDDDDQPDRDRLSPGAAAQEVTLRGQLAELREMDEDEMDDADDMEDPILPDRTFARLRLQDGQTATLVFTGDVDIDDLAVSTGDQLTIRGRELLMNTRTVLHVHSMLVNGRPIDVSDD